MLTWKSIFDTLNIVAVICFSITGIIVLIILIIYYKNKKEDK